MNKKQFIPSVNFHLWEPCNMRCKFCFATFQDVKQSILPKGHLPKEQSIQVVQQLVDLGFEKITFVGGEPTLCPWLSELIFEAKSLGLTTMVVTNGSNLSNEFLLQNVKYLDWITLSIDSICDETNLQTGRAIVGKKTLTLADYKSLVDRIKRFKYRLKINTVVTSKNCNEQLDEIINYATPERWKIFQALPITGQNDGKIESFIVSKGKYQHFISNHRHLGGKIQIVAEQNKDMKGSYAMVDPAGRFFDNSNGKYIYSDPILEIGVTAAFKQVDISYSKFKARGGEYDWKN